jgi:hypothetical protein
MKIMSKKIYILLTVLFFASSGCQKEDFFDKFPPEIMFFQNTKVENADFNQVTLPQGTAEYQVKSRVSSPFKLKEIKIFVVAGSSETLLNTITSFGNTPNEYFVYQNITGISGNTEVKFVAWDTEGRQTSKTFKILFN